MRYKHQNGIKMRVLRNTGRISDVLELEDPGILDPDTDEFQQLIVMPPNPLRTKCALILRVIFFSVLAILVTTMFLILVNDHLKVGKTIYPNPVPVKVNLNQLRQPVNGTIAVAVPPVTVFNDVCVVIEQWKFDCHPEDGATEEVCIKRGCCWQAIEPRTGAPWCYYTKDFSYYTWSNFTSTKYGLRGIGQKVRSSPYPGDVESLDINVFYESDDSVRIRITDSKQSRFEVPLDYRSNSTTKAANPTYNVTMLRNGFQVYKIGQAFPLFDSTVAPIVYSDQFLQVSTSLNSPYIYGIGEVVDSMNRNLNWSRYVLYNHDVVPNEKLNLYGSHPFYLVMEKAGNNYGVFLANSNAMEIVLQPGPALTFRPIGGIIDLRIFLGPNPSDIMNQYTNVIGRPMLPPYWSLGFHLCRFNYGTLNHTEEILEANIRAGIPIDVQWNDLDYMSSSDDFTYDKVKFAGLPDFVKRLQQRGMHYVPLIDPGISGGEAPGNYTPFDDGLKMDIFIKDASGDIFVGKVWNPKSTVWPDFSHPNISQYWLRQLERFRKQVPLDGAWIDMNEPSNFWNGGRHGCYNESNLDNPPYVPHVDGGTLYYKTVCPSARQAGGSHYDLHNLYGTLETEITYKALGDLRQERPFVISRSTFPGQGKYGGHWTGDVWSKWSDMKKSIPQVLTFGLFGIPMVGADICGFNGNTTTELCKRWMQLGAFYPFSRNHNTDDGIPQDPYSLGPDVIEASKETLNLRYSLLPYIYSLFFRAHISGQPVARPLFYEFPSDPMTYEIDEYFMLGPSVLIVPILEEGFIGDTLDAYLPHGWWYHHYFPQIEESFSEIKHLMVPKNSIPVLYRGGTVVVRQDPSSTTTSSRQNKFHIAVYLSEQGTATGELFWDDGVSNLPDVTGQYDHYVFKAEKNVLTMSKEHDGYPEGVRNMTLGSVEIHGVFFSVNDVIFNNVAFKQFSLENKTLIFYGLSLTGNSWTDGFTMEWK